MRLQEIYLDTSVIGGCFDDEFKIWSNGLIQDISKGIFRGVTSDVVVAEIADSPEFVKEKYKEFLSYNPIFIEVNDETLDLLNEYLLHNILSTKYRNDMLHIAIATVNNIDILVSWNYKHIVRYDKIRQFNAVNIEQGYHSISIYSPREVSFYEKD
jgi:predicted nucleic acid-binding protein